ncbi:MAG: alpha/beta fold hydrolase, partial [Candidatus Binatia bacterium]
GRADLEHGKAPTMKKALLAPLVAVTVVLVIVYFFFPGLTLALAERAELVAAGLERGEIDVAGHHVVYLSGGSGEPVVLLHGFSAEKNNWVRVARYLTAHVRVIAPDLPGFGESTRDPNARYGTAEQVERVRAFVQALGLRSFHLGGNSMGGQIAAVYAAKYPGEVKSLWLLAPGGIASAEKSELQELFEKGENPFAFDDAEGFDRLLRFAFVEVPPIPGPVKRHLARRALADQAFNEKIAKELQEGFEPLEPKLRDLQVPTLVVWGDQDRLLHVSGAAVLGSILPKSRVVVMKNVGHVPMLERPEESAREFLRFQGFEPPA